MQTHLETFWICDGTFKVTKMSEQNAIKQRVADLTGSDDKAVDARTADPAQLYVDLMRKTLSFALWKDPGVPVETLFYRLPLILRPVARLASSCLRRLNLGLVCCVNYREHDRQIGKVLPSLADTMIGMRRLINIQTCVETVLKENVPGDLIETGVWRGGCCIFMRAILAAHGVRDRRVFAADSFKGLPDPNVQQYPQDKDCPWHKEDYLAVSQEEVAANFKKYGLLDEQVVFLKGWFKDTLAVAPIQQLAVLRLDGDMYESTMEALNALYHKLSKGGFCIIDDYDCVECKAAVEEFRTRHGIQSPLMEIDWTGRFWRKE